DQSPRKIKADLISSLSAQNPPELHIFANALNTEDISSFYALFSPFIETLEKEVRKASDAKNIKTDAYPHIQIHPIEGLPGGYPAYCFTFKRRKFLALPEMSLTGADFTEYLIEAVAKAKDIFFSAFESCPDGYIYSNEKNTTAKDRLLSMFAKAPAEELQMEEAPFTESEVGTMEPLAPTDIDKDLEQTVIFDTDIKGEPAPAVIKVSTLADEITASLTSKTEERDEAEAIPEISEEKPAKVPAEEPSQAPADNSLETPAQAPAEKIEEKTEEITEEVKSPEDNTSGDFDFIPDIFSKKKSKEKHKKHVTEKTEEESAEVAPEDITPEETIADTENNEDKPKKKGKFKVFLKSFIPMKGDSKKSIVLKIVVLVAILTFLVGAFLLLKFYVIDPAVNNSDMEDIQNVFYSSGESETVIKEVVDENGVVSTIVTTKAPTRNWKAVKDINKEIVGWIKLDGTKIDYPVLFHKEDTEDNLFYLYKNYKKKYSDFGSIFVDYRCPEGGESKHVVLHGHNMGSDKDSMFGSLVKYTIKDGRTKANPEYYKSHAVINYDTPETNGEWVVFAVMKIDVSNSNKNIFNYLLSDFENNAQFLNFIYNIKERSYFDVNIPINENDRILTLSTCSYETDNMRTIVVARKVRDGEDVSTYVKSAKGKSPASSVTSDFVTEYDNIKWYDGEGKPTGNGMLEFMTQSEMFTVKFYDAYGKVIRTEKVLKGKDAVGIVGAPPVKESDGTYHYRFIKWDKSYKKVTKDLEIRPVYEKSLIPVTTPTIQDNPVITPEPTSAPTTKPTQAPTTSAPTQAPTSAPVTTQAPTQAPTPAPTQTETPVSEDTPTP
ncbi:MAG: sortase, partial [Ruminococcus sp.]|nr:sortase [Ruminococcus sp.]